jgi:hypothetical protein
MSETKSIESETPAAVAGASPCTANQYKVVDGSQSCHCCFSETVVDTTKPAMIGGKHYESQYEAVCECFEADDAKLICDALNAYSQNGPDQGHRASDSKQP